MLLDKESSLKIQSDFAKFCKTGDQSIHIPGAGKYIGQYHELMHNVMIDTIDSNFPLAKKLLKKKDWANLTKEFVMYHSCISPQIWTMPKEFLNYVLENKKVLLESYPPLKDMLLFDWKETEIFMMEDARVPFFTTAGNIFNNSLVLNPEIEFVHFNYPVFSKKPKSIGSEDFGNYYVLFYRNLKDGDVNHWEIPPAYVRVLEVLLEKPQKALQVAQKVCDEAQVTFDKDIENKVFAFLEICMEKEIILGFQKV